MDWNGWTVYLASILIFMFLGYYILDSLIFEEYEVKKWSPVMSFCLIFAFSTNTLELLIFEILKIGSEE